MILQITIENNNTKLHLSPLPPRQALLLGVGEVGEVAAVDKSVAVVLATYWYHNRTNKTTLYTVDATKYVTVQIDATFHEGRGNGER